MSDEWQIARGRGKTFSSNYFKAGRKNVSYHGGEDAVANPAISKALGNIVRWEQDAMLLEYAARIFEHVREMVLRVRTSSTTSPVRLVRVRLVALGLGSFCENYNAQTQLALHNLLKRKLETSYEVLHSYVYDPAMDNDDDKALAQQNVLTFDKNIEKYFMENNVVTILYMPVCPAFLYWEVLAKCAERVIILGNSLRDVAERKLSAEESSSGVTIPNLNPVANLDAWTSEVGAPVPASDTLILYSDTICTTSGTKDTVACKFGGSLALHLIAKVPEAKNKLSDSNCSIPTSSVPGRCTSISMPDLRNFQDGGSASSAVFYPYPLVPERLETGMEVFVNLKSMQIDSRATIVSVENNRGDELGVKLGFKTCKDNRDEGVKRRFQNLRWPADQKRIKTERKRKEQCGHLPIYVTRSTTEFRNCCLTQLDPEAEVVLEIGCSSGMCTASMMCKNAKKQLAVDISPEALKSCYERCVLSNNTKGTNYSSTEQILKFTHTEKTSVTATSDMKTTPVRSTCFEIGSRLRIFFFDVFLSDFESVLQQHVQSLEEITLLVIDIGGDRNRDQVLRALVLCKEKLTNLRVVIIKSEELADTGIEQLNTAWQSGKLYQLSRTYETKKRLRKESSDSGAPSGAAKAPRVPKELLESNLAEETHSTNIQLKKKLRRARKQAQ